MSLNNQNARLHDLVDDDVDIDNARLSDLFDKAWRLQRDLNKSNDESTESFELNRKKAIKYLTKCEFMLDELHLFSDNETLDETSTSELRYFLNYALLGWLHSKVTATKPEVRLLDLELAKLYYYKYLNLTKNYELHNYGLAKFKQSEQSDTQEKQPKLDGTERDKQAAFDSNLINMAYERNEKIRRYKEQKELEKQLELLSVIFEIKNREQIDDEKRRETYIKFFKYWINKSIDDMKLIDDEINILRSIVLEKVGRVEPESKAAHAKGTDQQAKKPFIITKDQLQAKVFGAGYPSLPVYSIEQFYDQLADKGMMPKSSGSGQSHHEEKGPVQIGGGVTETQKEEDKAEKDKLEDANDEQELRRQREWDEFKDDNKRGSGNRFNRS